MSSVEYTQVTYDSSSISNQDVNDATQVLVDDINQLYMDEYDVSQTDKALQNSTDKLGSESSDEFGSCWITLVTETMSLDCNVMAGLMVCMADMMSILSDIRNISTISQNGFMSMTSNGTDNPDGSTNTYDHTDDMAAFEDGLDVLTTTTFTVTYADGSTGTATGIIDLLSNPDYWPDSRPPMSEQTADLLNTDIDGIEGEFSDWGNTSSMWNQIDAWANPVADSEGIVAPSNQITEINNNYTAIGDSIDSDTNKLTSELQVAMTQYQSYQDTWEQVMQYLAEWSKTALQGMGA